MTDLHPECPLCRQPVGEGDEAAPVWTDPPGGRSVTSRGTAGQPGGTRKAAFDGSTGEITVLGRSVGEIGALLEAIRKNDAVEVDTFESVEEIRQLGRAEPVAFAEDPTPVDTTRRGDKAGARLTVSAPDPGEPDHVMHAECRDAVFGGGP